MYFLTFRPPNAIKEESELLSSHSLVGLPSVDVGSKNICSSIAGEACLVTFNNLFGLFDSSQTRSTIAYFVLFVWQAASCYYLDIISCVCMFCPTIDRTFRFTFSDVYAYVHHTHISTYIDTFVQACFPACKMQTNVLYVWAIVIIKRFIYG